MKERHAEGVISIKQVWNSKKIHKTKSATHVGPGPYLRGKIILLVGAGLHPSKLCEYACQIPLCRFQLSTIPICRVLASSQGKDDQANEQKDHRGVRSY
jgi:hypothetical protein